VGAGQQQALGIDIGGTGVKAALVDLASGELVSSRTRVKTPNPSTPAAVAETVSLVINRIAAEVELAADLPVGCGLPGVIRHGRLLTAANIDKGWLDVSAEEVIGNALGRRVRAINDADAAGLAEVRFGAGRGEMGIVLLLTIGTGIGSALFYRGHLQPSTELGHFRFRGDDVEKRLSGAARERRGTRWKSWASAFSDYLGQLETIFNPDLIILGGGVSKEMAKYGDYLKARAPIVPAQYLNTAGIIGAALFAASAE
jgi:polyphosphate glucokinase